MNPRIVLAVVLAAALPAGFTLDPAPDSDVWWHLRTGQIVGESGPPRTEPFSRVGRESPMPWVAYSWLFEWVLYRFHAAFGLPGVMAFRVILGACGVAAYVTFAFRRLGAGPAGCVAAVLAIVTLMPMMKERPWHVTIVFTTLTLAVVCRLREVPDSRAWWLLIVFAVWANLHIQFVFGWLILGIACVFPGITSRRLFMLLLAGCVLATLVNPYHVRLLGVIWEYATQTGPLRTVNELAPPEWNSIWLWAALGLIGWATVRAIVRRPVDGFSLMLLAVGLFFTLRMRRDAWFGAVTALAVLGNNGAIPRISSGIVAGIVAGSFLAIRLVNLAGFGPPPEFDAATRSNYPVGAAEWVREHHPPGPLFNPFDWGGYLIWALPEYPVSIDGRTNVYGSDAITRGMQTWLAEPGWDADPNLTSANIVIAFRHGPLAAELQKRPKTWQIAYRDETAIVFVRNPPRSDTLKP